LASGLPLLGASGILAARCCENPTLSIREVLDWQGHPTPAADSQILGLNGKSWLFVSWRALELESHRDYSNPTYLQHLDEFVAHCDMRPP
jgi:hypothetical protein